MGLADEKYVLFTTFKRDGTAVATPVWSVGIDDTSIGFWTSSGSGKAKRPAHTAKVLVQPCDARGKVRDESTVVEASAEVVTGAQLDLVRAKVEAKYGFVTKIT